YLKDSIADSIRYITVMYMDSRQNMLKPMPQQWLRGGGSRTWFTQKQALVKAIRPIDDSCMISSTGTGVSITATSAHASPRFAVSPGSLNCFETDFIVMHTVAPMGLNRLTADLYYKNELSTRYDLLHQVHASTSDGHNLIFPLRSIA